MKAELKGVCRGNGHIYAKLAVETSGNAEDVSASVTTGKGSALPSKLYALPGPSGNSDGSSDPGDPNAPTVANFALVMPLLLKGTQVITVAGIEDGAAVAVRIAIPMSRAKWESRFNYRFRKDLAAEIRGIDERDLADRIDFEFEEIIPDEDELHVNLELRLEPHAETDLEISVFDSAGEPLDARPTCVADFIRLDERDPHLPIHALRYSVRVPVEENRFTVAVRDRKSAARGFTTIEQPAFDFSWGRGQFMWQHAVLDPIYPGWYEARRATPARIERQKHVKFDHGAKFSLIVPLYHTDPALFAETVESVLAQSYADWELVLVNSTPEDEALTEAVARYTAQDERIRCVTLASNLGISGNTNEGIRAATGQFIAFFDHDDLLEPDALYEYARAVDQHPDIDLMYCDEDKVTEDGAGLFHPNFKPEFDLELLRSNNYVCHLLCVSRRLLDEIGLVDSRYDGAQDHDLTLRAAERARRIHHVPRILYHWRAIEGSTAHDSTAKTYAHDAGEAAIQAHMDRMGIHGKLVPTPWLFVHRIKYLVTGDPLVSIIIPNKDNRALLEGCVRSVLDKTGYQNFEIVIVENNSVEEETFATYRTLEALDERISVIEFDGPFNFSKIINLGAARSRGDYLLLLNNDTEVINPEWLEEMLGTCQQDGIGAVGARLLYRDDTVQHAGIVITNSYTGGHHAYGGMPDRAWGYFFGSVIRRHCIAVTGACLIVSRSDFDSVGGFTEELSVAYNDVDFCLKLRERGLGTVYEPAARLHHYESASRGSDLLSPEKHMRLIREQSYMHAHWSEVYVKGDPWLNPNLTSKYYKLNTWENCR